MAFVRSYFNQVKSTLDQLAEEQIEEVIGVLHEARMHRRTIFIMGNGGSASTATHFCADLSKNTRKPGWPNFRVLGLSDNMAAVTAYANDEGYENVFANQLANFIQPKDIVIAISASGNSPNVIRAVELARRVGAVSIGFTGFTGGLLGQMVDHHLHVPSDIIEQVEDIHLMFEHVMVKVLRDQVDELDEVYGVGARTPILLPSLERIQQHGTRLAHDLLSTLAYEMNRGQMTPQDLLRRALQVTLEGLGAISGSLMVLNERGELIDAVMAYGGEVQTPDPRRLSDMVECGLAGWVVNNRQAALVDSTRDDPRWLPREWDQSQEGARSAVSVPLLDHERVVGVMTLVNSQAGQFNQEHLVLMTTIAVLVSFMAVNSIKASSSFAAL